MFGENEQVSPTFFRSMPEDSLMVTSIFATLQGEGPFAGDPCVFLRLTKCNLQCTFCDTFFDNGKTMLFEDVFTDINFAAGAAFHNHLPRTKPLVIVTGGEPMLQKNAAKFITRYGDDFRFQIESNGTLLRPIGPDAILIVSPKANPRGGYNPLRPDVLARANALKFVVSADPMNVHHTVPAYADHFLMDNGPRSVFISPMNTYLRKPKIEIKDGHYCKDEIASYWTKDLLDLEQNQRNHDYAAKLCMDRGFTFNVQQHLLTNLP